MKSISRKLMFTAIVLMSSGIAFQAQANNGKQREIKQRSASSPQQGKKSFLNFKEIFSEMEDLLLKGLGDKINTGGEGEPPVIPPPDDKPFTGVDKGKK